MNWNQDLQHPRTTQIAYRGQNCLTIKQTTHLRPIPPTTTQTIYAEGKIALPSSITTYQHPRPPRTTQTA